MNRENKTAEGGRLIGDGLTVELYLKSMEACVCLDDLNVYIEGKYFELLLLNKHQRHIQFCACFDWVIWKTGLRSQLFRYLTKFLLRIV